MSSLVQKVGHDPNITTFAVTPFKKARVGETLFFELAVSADAGKNQLKHPEAKPNRPGYGNFSILCDEGTPYGGDDSAPSPLSYFATGIACCVLSHLTMHQDAFELEIAAIRVELRMRFSGTATMQDLLKDGLFGNSDGLEAHISITSDEPREKLQAMFDSSVAACLALQTVRNPVPVDAKLHLDSAA
jgi:uncharacterized OsmC-like protein